MGRDCPLDKDIHKTFTLRPGPLFILVFQTEVMRCDSCNNSKAYVYI